jgi:hypothetical protein
MDCRFRIEDWRTAVESHGAHGGPRGTRASLDGLSSRNKEDQMAVNKPTGDKARRGAVRKRSQTQE